MIATRTASTTHTHQPEEKFLLAFWPPIFAPELARSSDFKSMHLSYLYYGYISELGHFNFYYILLVIYYVISRLKSVHFGSFCSDVALDGASSPGRNCTPTHLILLV